MQENSLEPSASLAQILRESFLADAKVQRRHSEMSARDGSPRHLLHVTHPGKAEDAGAQEELPDLSAFLSSEELHKSVNLARQAIGQRPQEETPHAPNASPEKKKFPQSHRPLSPDRQTQQPVTKENIIRNNRSPIESHPDLQRQIRNTPYGPETQSKKEFLNKAADFIEELSSLFKANSSKRIRPRTCKAHRSRSHAKAQADSAVFGLNADDRERTVPPSGNQLLIEADDREGPTPPFVHQLDIQTESCLEEAECGQQEGGKAELCESGEVEGCDAEGLLLPDAEQSEEPVVDPPRFIQKLKSREVPEGSKVQLDCIVSGFPVPEVRWFCEGKELENSPDIQILSIGELHSLIIAEAFEEDTGRYSCFASNFYGTDSTSAEIYIEGASSSDSDGEQIFVGVAQVQRKTSTSFPVLPPSTSEEDSLSTLPPVCPPAVQYPKQEVPTPRPAQVSSPLHVQWSTPLPAEVSTVLPAQEVSTLSPAQVVSTPVIAQEVSTPLPAQEVSTLLPAQQVSTPLPAQVVSTLLPAQVSTPLPAQVVSTPLPVQVSTPLPAQVSTVLPVQVSTLQPIQEVSTLLPIQVSTSLPAQLSTLLSVQEVSTPLPAQVSAPLIAEAVSIPLDALQTALQEVTHSENFNSYPQGLDGRPIMAAPVFTKSLQDLSAFEGQLVVLECRVKGVPSPRVDWYREGTLIDDSPDFRILQKKPRSMAESEEICTLVIAEAFPEDSGTFTCTAVNKYGIVSSIAYLKVKAKESHSVDTKMASKGTVGPVKHKVPEPASPVLTRPGIKPQEDAVASELRASMFSAHPVGGDVKPRTEPALPNLGGPLSSALPPDRLNPKLQGSEVSNAEPCPTRVPSQDPPPSILKPRLEGCAAASNPPATEVTLFNHAEPRPGLPAPEPAQSCLKPKLEGVLVNHNEPRSSSRVGLRVHFKLPEDEEESEASEDSESTEDPAALLNKGPPPILAKPKLQSISIYPPYPSPLLVSTRQANSQRAVNSAFFKTEFAHPRSGDYLTCFTADPSQLTLPPPPGADSQMPPPIRADDQSRSGREGFRTTSLTGSAHRIGPAKIRDSVQLQILHNQVLLEQQQDGATQSQPDASSLPTTTYHEPQPAPMNLHNSTATPQPQTAHTTSTNMTQSFSYTTTSNSTTQSFNYTRPKEFLAAQALSPVSSLSPTESPVPFLNAMAAQLPQRQFIEVNSPPFLPTVNQFTQSPKLFPTRVLQSPTSPPSFVSSPPPMPHHLFGLAFPLRTQSPPQASSPTPSGSTPSPIQNPVAFLSSVLPSLPTSPPPQTNAMGLPRGAPIMPPQGLMKRAPRTVRSFSDEEIRDSKDSLVYDLEKKLRFKGDATHNGQQEYRVSNFEQRLMSEIEFRLERTPVEESDDEVQHDEIPTGKCIAPIFDKKLRHFRAMEGVAMTFTCKVVGIPIPKVYWFKDGKQILKKNVHYKKMREGDGTCALHIESTTNDDDGNYTVMAANPQGRISCSGHLIVQTGPVRGRLTPMIHSQRVRSRVQEAEDGEPIQERFFRPHFLQAPGDMVAHEGRLCRLDCKVSGLPNPDLMWLRNGKPILPDFYHRMLVRENGIHSLLIDPLKQSDAGTYTCIATNKAGQNSFCLELSVVERELKRGPMFVERLQNTGIAEGSPVRLECRVLGMPPPVIYWKKDNDTIPPMKGRLSMHQDATGYVCLLIQPSRKEDAGWYTVSAKNEAGIVSCTARLDIYAQWHQQIPLPMKATRAVGSRYAALASQGLDILSAFPTMDNSPILFASTPAEAALESEEL